MNLSHQEIQDILQQLYQLLKNDIVREDPSEASDRIRDRSIQASETLQTTTVAAKRSDLISPPQKRELAIDDSSLGDAEQVQTYLNQLGIFLSDENNRQPSINDPVNEGSDRTSEGSSEERESSIKTERTECADDFTQTSQSSEVNSSVKTSEEQKDVETAGILEELLQQFCLDPMNPEAIDYEELFGQLAIDRTDPKTIKELNRLMNRLRAQVAENDLDDSLSQLLGLDDDEWVKKDSDRPFDNTHVPIALNELDPTTEDLWSSVQSNASSQSSEQASRENVSSQKASNKSRKDRAVFWILSGVLLGCMILVPWLIYQYMKTSAIEKKVTKVLDSSPGIGFYHIKADVEGNVLVLTGKLPHQHLSDRATTIASSTAPDLAIENKIIVVDRPADLVQVGAEIEDAIAILNQIDGINISAKFERGQVILQGTSIQQITIKNITRIFEDIPGIRQIDNQIKIQPLSIPVRIYFNQNSSNIIQDDLDSKIYQIKDVLQKYPHLQLKIIGYSHNTESSHQTLELQRAQAVENFLEDRGIDRRRIQVESGNGSPPDIASNQERWLSRSVVFEIIQSDLEQAEK